jgi:hypothetical protein
VRIAIRRSIFVLLAAIPFLPFLAFSQTLTGTVKNATTGKPASGDDVILLKLGQGMEEAGRTQADSKGNFTFKLDDAQAPHLIRAVHQEVTYHRMAPPGTTSVEVDVYDVSKKVEGIEVVADVMWIQTEKGQLEIIRKFAVQNSSKPLRTQMNDRNLEFFIPEGAQIVEGSAKTQNGQPINSAPVQERDKTRYAFIFPLRPGTTEFTVAYELPYTGSANMDPKPLYPLQHFVAILPKSMQFSAAPNTNFKPMDNPNEPQTITQVASTTTPGQTLAFKVSGEGVLQGRAEGGGAQGESAQGSGPGEPSSADSRPGGGLGPPIDAPDPLQKYRWYILGGFAVVLIGGAVYVASRQQSANRAALRSKALRVKEEDSDYELDYEGDRGANQPAAARRSSSSSSMLLEALKEELFQLELERRQGNISQQEYEKSKAALDHTLDRALKREGAKQT